MLKSVYLEADRGEGDLYEIFSVEYSLKMSKEISKLVKKGLSITGIVPKDKKPSEGGSFVLYHHKVGNVVKFGTLSLPKCVNVAEEEGSYYFEDTQGIGKYLLIPAVSN